MTNQQSFYKKAVSMLEYMDLTVLGSTTGIDQSQPSTSIALV